MLISIMVALPVISRQEETAQIDKEIYKNLRRKKNRREKHDAQTKNLIIKMRRTLKVDCFSNSVSNVFVI